jgi:hypothetical protein
MKKDAFTLFMDEMGFSKVKHPLGYASSFERLREGTKQFVVRDNVRGGAFRLFLGHGCIPAMDPPDIKSKGSIEAESPWFDYIEGYKSSSEALLECIEFMKRVGIPWLTNPLQHPHEYWMIQEKMLISVGGRQLLVPKSRRILP